MDTLETPVHFKEQASSARTDVILNRDHPRVPHSQLHKELSNRAACGGKAALAMGSKLGKEMRRQSALLPLAEDLKPKASSLKPDDPEPIAQSLKSEPLSVPLPKI
jgi:hypothetical protein